MSAEVKQAYAVKTEDHLMRLAAEKPGDARVHVFIGTYYRAINEFGKAREQLAIARTLSPQKQSIIIQQGFIELSEAKDPEALAFFKEAYELDTRNLEAKEYYAGALFYNDKPEEAVALMDSEAALIRFANSDFLLAAANDAGQKDFLVTLFTKRTELKPEEAQNWATLAFLYHDKGDKEGAIKILEQGKEKAPTFARAAVCIADNIKNNRPPEEGCSGSAPATKTPAIKQ